MKKMIMINMAIVSISNLLYAGGDILPLVLETKEVLVPYVAPVILRAKPIPVSKPVVLENIIPLGLYVAVGLTAARYDPNCACTTSKGDVDKTAGVIARIGYDFNEFIGVEARGIRTNWKSDGGKIKHVGLFVKPMYPVSTDVNVYALGGYAKTTTQGMKRSVDAVTLAWGLGLEYDLGKDTPKAGKYNRAFDGYGDQEGGWGLFADYERLVQKSGSPDLDTINMGITYDF